MLNDICRIHFHFRSNAAIMAGNRDLGNQSESYNCIIRGWEFNNYCYYMTGSVSGQDESNPALWLATRAGKMELSCPLGTTRRVPQEKFPRKACSVKMAGYWPRSFFASLWTETESRSINTQKRNLANIQPSWPHTWSITRTYHT